MSKISLYPLDSTIDPEDKVIGTDGADGADNGVTKNYSIAALGTYINALGVESVSTSDGTFIDLTPNAPTIGNVIVTADLSATGTADSTTFLRGDNTWALVPTGSTYNLTSDQNSVNVDINLTQLPLGDVDTVSLIAGTNIQLVDDNSNNITINCTATSGIDGSGTANYLPVWQDADTLTDSFIQATYAASAGLVTLGVNADIAIGIDDIVGDESYRFAINGVTQFAIRETGISTPKTISAQEYVKVGQSTDTAGPSNVGAIRYRSDANNSYQEMSMQTGAATYAWVIIQQNNW